MLRFAASLLAASLLVAACGGESVESEAQGVLDAEPELADVVVTKCEIYVDYESHEGEQIQEAYVCAVKNEATGEKGFAEFSRYFDHDLGLQANSDELDEIFTNEELEERPRRLRPSLLPVARRLVTGSVRKTVCRTTEGSPFYGDPRLLPVS